MYICPPTEYVRIFALRLLEPHRATDSIQEDRTVKKKMIIFARCQTARMEWKKKKLNSTYSRQSQSGFDAYCRQRLGPGNFNMVDRRKETAFFCAKRLILVDSVSFFFFSFDSFARLSAAIKCLLRNEFLFDSENFFFGDLCGKMRWERNATQMHSLRSLTEWKLYYEIYEFNEWRRRIQLQYLWVNICYLFWIRAYALF